MSILTTHLQLLERYWILQLSSMDQRPPLGNLLEHTFGDFGCEESAGGVQREGFEFLQRDLPIHIFVHCR